MKKRHSRILLSGSFLALFLMTGQVQAATLGFFSVDGNIDSTFGSPCFTIGCSSVPTTIRAEGVFDFDLVSVVGDSSINLFDFGHNLDIILGDTIFSTSDFDSFFFDDPVMSFVDGAFFGFELFTVELEQEFLVDGFPEIFVVADLISAGLGFTATSLEPDLEEFDSIVLGDISGTWDASSFSPDFRTDTPSVVPVPAAVWLFGTALLGMAGFSKRKKVRT